jgi:hypothetical protein
LIVEESASPAITYRYMGSDIFSNSWIEVFTLYLIAKEEHMDTSWIVYASVRVLLYMSAASVPGVSRRACGPDAA